MVRRLKILLVTPRCLDERITDEDARVVPIGLYYIGALLMDNGFETRIINLAQTDPDGSSQNSRDPVTVFKKEMAAFKPDIVGFSVTNPNRINAMACADTAKQICPDTFIVFGGPAPTFMPGHLFEACPSIDFIVPGEGEVTFLKLAAALEKKADFSRKPVRGIIYRSGDTIVKTPPRPLLADLDTLVHPSDHFTYQHLALSRGCPGNCTFCGSPGFWGTRHVRFHSAQWIAREMETLYKKGVSHFYISDDTFTMDRQRVLALCGLIREKKLAVTWNAISRVDYIDADLLQAMRMAGCIQISFGVESGSAGIRKALGKPIPEEKIVRAFALTRSYGILPRTYFIYGSPGETEQTIRESADLLKKIEPLGAVFYMLVIFPGTRLYRSAVQKKRVADTVWHRQIEDLPWFEVDPSLDFPRVKTYGDTLRSAFYNHIDTFARHIDLVDRKMLYPFHADFLSRLAMTFSHGEYARDSRVKNADKTAVFLYQKALSYAPDARAFLGLGMLMQKKRQFHDAVDVLKKGLVHAPNHPDLMICLGVCRMNLGQFKEALTCFEPLEHLHRTRHYITICRQQTAGQKK